MNEIDNKYSKRNLEELIKNPKDLKLEAYLSKGLVYKYLKLNNIELSKELLTDEAFNIFAIYELEELLKKEGLEIKKIEKFIIEQIKKTNESEFYSKEIDLKQIAHNNEEEFKNLVLSNAEELLKKHNLKEFIKENGLSNYISVKKLEDAINIKSLDVMSELLILVKNNKLEEAIIFHKENKEHPELTEMKTVQKEIEEIFNLELSEVNEYVFEKNQKEIDLFLNKWILFIDSKENEIVNTYANKTKEHIVKCITNKIPFNNLNELAIESLNILKISYAKGDGRVKLRSELEKIIYSEDVYRKDFSFNVIKALDLDWDNDLDKKLLIDFVEKFSKERELQELFRKTEIYKQISEDDIKTYLPILTKKFLDLDDIEKNEDFVIKKFKSLHSKEKVCMSDLVKFFLEKEDSYYNTFYFNYDEALEKLVKSLLEDGVIINVSNLNYGFNNNESKSFMFMKVFNAVAKLNKDFYKNLTIKSIEELMETIAEKEYYNYKIIINNFPVVLEFEKNINEAIKLVIDNNYEKEIESIFVDNIQSSYSIELISILIVSLLTKDSSLSSNELMILSRLLNSNIDYSKGYHSNDSSKELLEKGFTINDLLGENVDIFKMLEKQTILNKKFSSKELSDNILGNIEAIYSLEKRSRLRSKESLKDIYIVVLMDKLFDKSRNQNVSDLEYGQMLYIAENKFSYQLNQEMKDKLSVLRKKYPWNKTFDKKFILNKDNILDIDMKTIENSDNLFLTQFNKNNVYSDDELNNIVQALIYEEKSSYSDRKKIELYYSIINKVKDINLLSSYSKTKESLLKVVKREDYKSVFEKVVKNVKENLGLSVDKYSLKDIYDFNLDEKTKDDFIELLDKVGFETLNTVEVYSNMIKNSSFEKLNIIIEYFNRREDLSKTFSKIDFTLQEKVLDSEKFKNKSLSDEGKYFSSREGFSFQLNCQNFDEFNRAVERLKPTEQCKLIINGGAYYGNVDAYLWEGGGVLNKINIPDDKETISYILDNFALSIMDSYSLGRIPDRLERSLNSQELLSIYRNVKKKAGSIFSATKNVNAGMDWLEIRNSNNFKTDNERMLNKNSSLKEIVDTLEGLKEEPLLYILYLYENRLFIDQLSHTLTVKKDENSYSSDNYSIAKVSPDVSPMYELLELLKSYPETKEMFSYKKTEFDEGFINAVFYKNFVDFDVLVKGLVEGFKEIEIEKYTNSRLTDMVSYIYKYELTYSKKLDRNKDYGAETLKETLFDDKELKRLVVEIGKVNPGILMSYGLVRHMFSQTSEAKDCKLNQEDLSAEDAAKLARFIVNSFFEKEDLKEMLNAKFNFYNENQEVLFKEILNKKLNQMDNNFIDDINYSEKILNKTLKYLSDKSLVDINSYSQFVEEGLAYNLLKREDSSLVQSFIDRSQMALDIEKVEVKASPVKRSKPVKF